MHIFFNEFTSKKLFCLPFVVADENPHVLITIGYLLHSAKIIKFNVTKNEIHFI